MAVLFSIILAIALVLPLPETAAAYIGPGAGISLVGSFFGLLLGILTAVAVILFWPVRRLIRRIKKKARADLQTNGVPTQQTSSPEATVEEEDRGERAEAR